MAVRKEDMRQNLHLNLFSSHLPARLCPHAGISGKSQILFALVFTTRYLDLFTTFISAYNTVMKVRRGSTKARGFPRLAVVSWGRGGRTFTTLAFQPEGGRRNAISSNQHQIQSGSYTEGQLKMLPLVSIDHKTPSLR